MLKSPLLVALLIASLIANVALFLFPYDWQNDKYPPGEHESANRGTATQIQTWPAIHKNSDRV